MGGGTPPAGPRAPSWMSLFVERWGAEGPLDVAMAGPSPKAAKTSPGRLKPIRSAGWCFASALSRPRMRSALATRGAGRILSGGGSAEPTRLLAAIWPAVGAANGVGVVGTICTWRPARKPQASGGPLPGISCSPAEVRRMRQPMLLTGASSQQISVTEAVRHSVLGGS